MKENCLFMLKTDFRDYYDHWFDRLYICGDEEISIIHLDRKSKNDVDRIAMFNEFKKAGYDNLEFSKESPDELECDMIVYHDDIFSHCGEGKMLMSSEAAKLMKKGLYVRCYETGVSYRSLRIGRYFFLLRYKNNSGNFRSNCGDVEIEILEKYKKSDDKVMFPVTSEIIMKSHDSWEISSPLYAIDFVVDDRQDRKSALRFVPIDLNTSPCIRGTGIEDQLPAKIIAEEIQEKMLMNYKAKEKREENEMQSM